MTILAAVAMLALASPARAGFVLTLQEGATSQTFNLTSGQLNTVGPITIGDYQVSVTARDSAPGINQTFGGALVSQNTFTVAATSPAAAPLQITLQDDTFSSAPYASAGSLTVKNSLSTSDITSGTVTANGFLNSLTTADISLSGPTLNDSVANSITGAVALGSTFTLGNQAVVSFTGQGEQEANFTVTTVVPTPTPVPEPATVVAALTGLPLCIGVWMRRRRQMA